MVEQAEFLHGHPIFHLRNPLHTSFDLSMVNLPSFKDSRGSTFDLGTPSNGPGRRRIMTLRESDLILAVGNEIRITCLADAKTVGLQRRSYKTLHTPNIEFEIRQIAVNHNGKLLAVAGSHQVAVVSLPRAGYSKLVTFTVECRTIQVGQFHHATNSAAPISKVEWHPWGKSACTLLVMTTDGTLREYDVSIDPEEPQQTVLFMPERSRTASFRGDSSSREVVSFCFGKGKADWGPLTVYALTKSGDVWAICPFIPSNATVPSAYIHALEYFVRAKEELATDPQVQTHPYTASPHKLSLCTLYAYQLKYVVSLSKQLPAAPSTLFPAPSRLVPITTPSIVKSRPMRQGPFLFQPAPRELEDGQGGDATDLMYLSVDGASPDEDSDGERQGVLVVAYSDGKVDICLDVEKIEAMWDTSQFSASESSSSELPMVAVYETIDLGLVSMLSKLTTSMPPSWLKQQTSSNDLLDLLQVNHLTFTPDPIYEDMVYLYHAFGVHRLNMGPWLQPLASSLRSDVGEEIGRLVKNNVGTEVTSMLDTFSPGSRLSRPVGSVVLPSDVYLSYRLLTVTTSLDIQTFELALRVESSVASSGDHSPPPHFPPLLPPSIVDSVPSVEANDPSLLSLLSKEPYVPPRAISDAAVADVRKLATQTPIAQRRDIEITPETLRQFAQMVHTFQSRIRDVYMALNGLQDRLMLQDKEFQRQQGKYLEIVARAARLKDQEQARIRQRFENAAAEQKRQLARSDRMLQELMDTSSPVLNEHEKRWFAELKRMKADVLGVGSYDSASLRTRTDALANKLENYLPSLHEMAKREEKRKQEAACHPVTLGRGQELRVMMRLGEHKKMILDAIQKTEQMASRLSVELDEHQNIE